MILWILGFAALGSVAAVAGAALLLVFPERVRQTLLPGILSYATGSLLAAAFLAMIPSAADALPLTAATGTVLAGIVAFFLLEKMVIWRHSHDGTRVAHGTAGRLILVGDAFHNFTDGVVIAAAFLTSFPLGIAASLAVIAHEVPQEVGDFGILLDSGYSRQNATLYNLLSSITALPGAVAGYLWLAEMTTVTPYILGISAASFIYIAIADLVPALHRQTDPWSALQQLVLLLAGIATIILLQLVHWQ
jgi:zinc and cadmium transporter